MILTILKFFLINGSWLVSWNFTSLSFWALSRLMFFFLLAILLSFLTFGLSLVFIDFSTTFIHNFDGRSRLALIMISNIGKLLNCACLAISVLVCIRGLIWLLWLTWTFIIRFSTFSLIVGTRLNRLSGYSRRRGGRIGRVIVSPFLWIAFIVLWGRNIPSIHII